jgi:IS30 family transposase
MNRNVHLTPEQRYTIERCLVSGKFKSEIASMVGMHPSTICREIKRNGTIRGIYRAADAQNKCLSKNNFPVIWLAIFHNSIHHETCFGVDLYFDSSA